MHPRSAAQRFGKWSCNQASWLKRIISPRPQADVSIQTVDINCPRFRGFFDLIKQGTECSNECGQELLRVADGKKSTAAEF
jgi:hypothetical protein